MDAFSRIFTWLSQHEAGISAVAAIIVIAGVIFAGFRWLLRRRTEPTTKIDPEEDSLLALPTGPVVAVLPFENLSEDPKQEFFSDGLTEDIITALSRFRDLFVIGRNSTFRYKGQPVDVRQLKKELGARYVLEGSVQKAGDTLRVTAQLLDAKDGTHLWAETYDRELSASNIFAVQDEITEQVVATIAGMSGVISRARFAEVKEKPTDSLDAYECVLQFGAYARDKIVPTEHAKVRDGLERAVKSDPAYAGAWAALCVVYLHEHQLNFNPRPDPLDRALEAARRAVDLDPTNLSPHLALAEVYFSRHELDGFFAEAERAIALNPNEGTALAHLGMLFLQVGDERGIGFVRKAAALDPFHPTWLNFAIAHHHFDKGEYEEALAAARKINIPNNFFTQIYLAVIYAELGREAEARSAVEELLRLYPGFTSEKHVEELRKWNYPDETIHHWAAALRKAGLPSKRGAARKGAGMSLQDLGNIGEFVAAIAVIFSLVYLAIQIRQNTRSVRSSTNQGIRKMIQEIDLLLASDPELNRIWTVGRKDSACLDHDQWGRFSTLVLMFYRNFENAYYERQNKAVDERVYRPWAAYSLRLSSQPGVVRWWESYHELMSEEFQNYVERGRVAEDAPELPPISEADIGRTSDGET